MTVSLSKVIRAASRRLMGLSPFPSRRTVEGPTTATEPHPEDLTTRATKILGPIDPTSCGVEIGPLNNPLLRKTDANVLYVDWGTTEELRAKPYESSIDPAHIVEVDVVWSEQPLRDCMPESHRACDYVVAAHVIEHVPDIIGWLHDVRSILKPGGTLGLAIPDRRFTFDYCKNESTVGEMIEAWLLKYRRPSVRQVFDHCWLAVTLDAGEAWRRPPHGADLPKLSGDVALDLAFRQATEIAARPRYIDSHCWIFTPAGFLERLSVLARLRLLPFTVEFIEPTRKGTFEFVVRLTADDPARQDAILESIARAREIVAHGQEPYPTSLTT
jgi:hypothetical protein